VGRSHIACWVGWNLLYPTALLLLLLLLYIVSILQFYYAVQKRTSIFQDVNAVHRSGVCVMVLACLLSCSGLSSYLVCCVFASSSSVLSSCWSVVVLMLPSVTPRSTTLLHYLHVTQKHISAHSSSFRRLMHGNPRENFSESLEQFWLDICPCVTSDSYRVVYMYTRQLVTVG